MGDTGRRVCTVCVMDDFRDTVHFDKDGRCNCCKAAERLLEIHWHPGPDGEARLETLVERLKREGRQKPYDAFVGLSGGVDSAYLAHVMRTRYKLRLLAIHVDAGWNTEPAVCNIERLVKNLDLDLYTHVVEWDEMRDLQLAFLKSGVFDQDIPQDHAFFAVLYRIPDLFNVRWFLSGVNLASESVAPPGCGVSKLDLRHLKAIHRRFGEVPLRLFPTLGLLGYAWRARIRKKVMVARPLNWMDYRKDEAKEVLRREHGWVDYGQKHAESRWTKFYQQIYLPQRFGVDKRRWHLSSLIMSGQMSREKALQELETPPLTAKEEFREKRFVARKLGITVEELERLIRMPEVPHMAYPNSEWAWRTFVGMGRIVARYRETRRRMSISGIESPNGS